ncbi:MAG: CHAT domain-containing protein [Pseudolabrys sp.]
MARAMQVWRAGLALLLLAGSAVPALALTKQEAAARCRRSVGHPFVVSCIRGHHGSRASCKAQVKSRIRACVLKTLDAANKRKNVPVAMPEQQGPSKEVELRAAALPATYVAPPRTISDITAILDGEKPDAGKIAMRKAKADAEPPAHASHVQIARFYYGRAGARAKLGRLRDALDDSTKALQAAHGHVEASLLGRLEQQEGLLHLAAGDPKTALKIFKQELRNTRARGARGYAFNANLHMVAILAQMGDIDQAGSYLQQSDTLLHQARTSSLPGWRKSYARHGQSWEADVETTHAALSEARGQYAEALKAYRVAELRKRASIKQILAGRNPPPKGQIEQAADILVLGQSRMEARLGQFAQAEADARRALIARLKDQGKYSTSTPRFIMGLVHALVAEGRFSDAEKLVRVAIEIHRTMGVADDSQSAVAMLSNLGTILSLQFKRKEAATVYAAIDKATAKWDPRRRERFELNGSRIYALYAAGEVDKGIKWAKLLLKRNEGQFGQKHYDTAMSHGILAAGYMKAHRDADAAREFRAAIPALLAASRESEDDGSSALVAARNARLRSVAEAYMALLARDQKDDEDKTARETFALADAIRRHSVQQALAAASARAAISDPALAKLVRSEQDLGKRVNAQLGMLNNVLSLPSGQRGDNAVQTLEVSINNLRSQRDKDRAEIAKRFPRYADLIAPKPPSVDEIKAILKPGEALLSFYFGRQRSFVWAVPKKGKVAFAAIKLTADQLQKDVQTLRKTLEPQAESISDIPPFDLKLAYQLYSLLLKPVEPGWKPAKSLIVVTNGALGELPLSLLPTAPASDDDGDGPLFSGYRKVPWLARSHAVSVVPSAAALRTLRQMRPGSNKRLAMIGFGDPIFSKAQEKERENAAKVKVAMATRGAPLRTRSLPKLEGVNSADLALLPPLPDTALELKAIARALKEDPAKAVILGAKANEKTVKDTDLARYKIIVFATHGLATGELNGLTQPALALSAPAVAHVKGDGLLTMGEITALKLDADWEVLSACNTGAGAGKGAEAASGLGSAFFYAGARALLVTNWSVDSRSARQLTSGLFRLEENNSKLSRSEALRESMMSLVDHGGYKDSNGQMIFSYAHPLFWAPYSLIGDGGT